MQNLYVIGNGFDLFLGLKTRLSDFKNFLDKENEGSKFYNELVDHLTLATGGDFWSSFETSLGKLDEAALEEMARKFQEDRENRPWDFLEKDGSCRVDSDGLGFMEEDIQEVLEQITNDFPLLLNTWIQKQNFAADSEYERIEFNPNDKFLTFNYTSTLEGIEGVDPDNVLYIHGSALSGDNLIVGHAEAERKQYIDRKGYTEDHFYRIYKDFYEAYRKPTEKIISNNLEFFESLESIQKIIVLGHSLSKVDMPYFQKIREFAQNAFWIISYHSSYDNNRAYEFGEQLNLSRENLHLNDIDSILRAQSVIK